jgi:hypothetical protein
MKGPSGPFLFVDTKWNWTYNTVIVQHKMESKMKVLYTSPVFKNVDGTARQSMIPMNAINTYAKRDASLLAMIALGGINTTSTPEFMAHRKAMMSAKRKIEREGWYSSTNSRLLGRDPVELG